MTQRQLFLHHLAQTSNSPIAIEMVKAEGCYLWDDQGRSYLDLIAGISVCNLGHRHPVVLEAIKKQLDQYLHLLVYGELIQSPQVQYAKLLTDHLPAALDAVYFTNSGTEATEGAMKLAKRFTGRTQIIAFNKSYHGSTQGSLSIMGDEYWRNAFRPLLPGILHLEYGQEDSLKYIGPETACVVLEPVQAERGVVVPADRWLLQLRKRCSETGTLLVLDEIQTGFGRTGSLWRFESAGIIPDVLLLGKALGGGMPLGAFIASRELMHCLVEQPVLGHITTFGGHPVSCAAGMAALKELLGSNLIRTVSIKSRRIKEQLVHNRIKNIRSCGLILAVEFENEDINQRVIQYCIRNGVLTDWFLFAPQCLRLAPPLIIGEEEIDFACRIILDACDRVTD